MKAETRTFIKNAIAAAKEVWYDGSYGEPKYVYPSAYCKHPAFQVCRRLDITVWKEQIFAAIERKQAEWLLSVKGLNKSRLAAATETLTYGIKVETGIPEIDEIGLYAEFWNRYIHNRRYYAEAYEKGKFRFSVQRVWDVGSYTCSRCECKEWIIYLGDGKLYLENWTFPDFRNPDHKLPKGRCRNEYLKVVKADMTKAVEDGWLPCELKNKSVIFQKALQAQA